MNNNDLNYREIKEPEITEMQYRLIKEHDPKDVFADNAYERERAIRTQSKLTEDKTQMSQLIDRWVTNSFQ